MSWKEEGRFVRVVLAFLALLSSIKHLLEKRRPYLLRLFGSSEASAELSTFVVFANRTLIDADLLAVRDQKVQQVGGSSIR